MYYVIFVKKMNFKTLLTCLCIYTNIGGVWGGVCVYTHVSCIYFKYDKQHLPLLQLTTAGVTSASLQYS